MRENILQLLARRSPFSLSRLSHSLHPVQTVLGKSSQDRLGAGQGPLEYRGEVLEHSWPAREEHGEDEGEEAPALLEGASVGPAVTAASGELSEELTVEFVLQSWVTETGCYDVLRGSHMTLGGEVAEWSRHEHLHILYRREQSRGEEDK